MALVSVVKVGRAARKASPSAGKVPGLVLDGGVGSGVIGSGVIVMKWLLLYFTYYVKPSRDIEQEL
jgi:hypothetical protein